MSHVCGGDDVVVLVADDDSDDGCDSALISRHEPEALSVSKLYFVVLILLLRTMMVKVVMGMVMRMMLLLVMVMRMVALVSRHEAGAFSVGESYLASGLSVRHYVYYAAVHIEGKL